MPLASGNPNLYFGRDTHVYLVDGSNIWEIPILNGYAFSQGSNTSEVTLNEMSDSTGVSRRGKQLFTDSQAPAEWSFDTYVRPTIASALHRAPEEPLWANFVANSVMTAGAPDVWDKGVTIGAADLEFDFDDSNVTTLGVFDLYFVLGACTAGVVNYAANADTTIYKVSSCSINEVSITFDIDGIATLSWSGMGTTLREQASFDATAAIRTGIDQTNNFIRNRLTQVTATSSISGGSKNYNITLTGGTITFTNNISYLTPEVLCKVNTPLGHVTGTRSISGSFTCYLDEDTDGSIDLFEDISLASTAIRNSFALDFFVGGKSGGDAPVGPGIQFKIPTAHLELPVHNIDDVIGLEVNFTALPSSIGGTNEVSVIRYVGVSP